MKRVVCVVLVGWCAALAGCVWDSGGTGDPAPTTSEPAGHSASNLSAEGGSQSHTGGMDARDAGHNADPGAFGSSCTTGSDCESNVCFSGGKGGFCSLQCMSATQCPAGADGTQVCNPHGYCRY